MDYCIVLILSCAVMTVSAWSGPFHPIQRGPPRITRFVHPPPQHRVRSREPQDEQWQRPKRDHDDYHYDRDHDHGNSGRTSGVTGPIHTFVKTDKNANYKWGVRHHVGNKYAS